MEPALELQPLPLPELLGQLETAARDGDRALAAQLARVIWRCLPAEESRRAAVERYVQAVLAELEAPPAAAQEAHPDPGPTVGAAYFGVGEPVGFAEPPAADAGHGVAAGDYGDYAAGSPAPDGPADSDGAVPQGVVYPVWFGTNRQPAADGFTAERAEALSWGRVDVLVPAAHRRGQTGSSFWNRLWRCDLRDDHLRLQAVTRQDQQACFADLNAAVEAARAAGQVPDALVFLHGYNTGFADAAIRAAQIGYDLGVAGATAFFSWPSSRRVAAYLHDEAVVEASEGALTEFLVAFARHCRARQVHVVAHSMGNRGLLRALQRIAGNAELRGHVKFGQLFLAAPDVDRALFLSLAGLYPAHAARTTLYASSADLAVYLSSRLHDAPRAGFFEPYTLAPGIDTVAVPDFDFDHDLLGHGYFAQAEALLYDIGDLIRNNKSPDQRQRLTGTAVDGHRLWHFQR